jgi:methionine aminopeptidase
MFSSVCVYLVEQLQFISVCAWCLVRAYNRFLPGVQVQQLLYALQVAAQSYAMDNRRRMSHHACRRWSIYAGFLS